jgi:hypothetical protein
MSVKIDHEGIFTNIATPGFLPKAGDVFVWAARNGTLTEEVRLSNITAVTGGNLVQIPTTSPYYSDPNTWSSDPASAAFDGDYSSDWLTFYTNGYVGVSLSSPAVVKVYVTTTGNLRMTTDPRRWELDGSNDGATWTSCGTDGSQFVNLQETRAWMATNSTPYSAYRLNVLANDGDILANGNPGDTTLGELQLYELPTLNPRGGPQLQTASSGPTITFSWPTNGPTWVLQSTTNFLTGTWTAVTNTVSVVNTNYQVSVFSSTTNTYYELVQ